LPVQFDPSLGWVPRIGYAGISNKWGTQVTILANGIRSNGHDDREFETPPILVVGDSYTFCDEVSDNETWPAILESLLEKKVINGGVFAYGVDQSFLRLESLLPVYSPDTIILSLIPDDIGRSEYAVALGANKPYFQVYNNSLRLINTPVEQVRPEQASLIDKILGRSLLIHKIMMQISPNWWLAGRQWLGNHTGNSGEEITCLIFEEIKDIARQYDVRHIYILLQNSKRIRFQAQTDRVVECIDQDVITVIDLRNDLLAVKEADPVRYDSFFFRNHMTYDGNYFIAERIFEIILREQTTRGTKVLLQP
jgi:hypothetical protein